MENSLATYLNEALLRHTHFTNQKSPVGLYRISGCNINMGAGELVGGAVSMGLSLCASYLFISQNIRCLQLRGCFLEPWNKACVLQGAAQVHQDGRCSLLLPLANAAQQCNDSEDWDTKRRERKLPTDYVRTGTGLGEVSLLQTAAVGIFPNELW